MLRARPSRRGRPKTLRGLEYTPDGRPIFRLNYKPQPLLEEFHLSDARVRIAVCGRRFGKTVGLAGEACRLAIQNPGRPGWVVTPTYAHAETMWFFIKAIMPDYLVARDRRGEPLVRDGYPQKMTLITGANLGVRSAVKPVSLRSKGLAWLVIDEAAHVSEEAWNTVRPAVGTYRGRIVLASTPWGRNWFWREFVKARAQEDKPLAERTMAAWQFSSKLSNYLETEEYESVKGPGNYPDIWFQQEYDAKFISGGGAVFPTWPTCLVKNPALFKKGERAPSIGVDLAKAQDWTVITVLQPGKYERRNVAMLLKQQRFHRVPWPETRKRISQVHKDFGGHVWVDSSGIGDVVVDELQKDFSARGAEDKLHGVPTATRKTQRIDGLRIAMESKEVAWPDGQVNEEYRPLEAELDSFEYTLLRGGKVRYSAPQGLTDDCVIALSLAYHGLRNAPSEGVGLWIPGVYQFGICENKECKNVEDFGKLGNRCDGKPCPKCTKPVKGSHKKPEEPDGSDTDKPAS